MEKFVIECPNCHAYTEVKKGLWGTGILGTHTVKCACGQTFNVKANKMIVRTCPHCQSSVLFDQSKGDKALCPVCKGQINTGQSILKKVELLCPSCSCKIVTSKTDGEETCPLCNATFDVKQSIARQNLKDQGIISTIKYEGDNSTFVWKHPIEDFNLGSQLIVHESQEAVFFQGGQALDLFDASGSPYTLPTPNLPLAASLHQISSNANSIFHCEVYFVNLTTQMAIKWGTPDKVRYLDPQTGLPLEIGARGEINLKVCDSRKLLLKLVGTMRGIAWDDKQGFTKSLQESFRPLISNAVKTNFSSVIKAENIDLLEIDSHLDLLSESLRNKILPGFEEYGLTIPQLYVTDILYPSKDDIKKENYENFKRIQELHKIRVQEQEAQADASVKKAKIKANADVITAAAESKAQFRIAQEQSEAAIEEERRKTVLQRQQTETEIARMEAERQVIKAQADAQAAKMSGIAEAEVMAAKGYNQRDVIQAQVQESYAAGIGSMGANSSGGSTGGGIISDMVGLGVGLAAANAISPQLSNIMQGFNTPNSSSQPSSPIITDTWNCSCGNVGIKEAFCGKCGGKRPSAADIWDCPCGNKGVTELFCGKCGRKKPDPLKTWDCTCGNKGISEMFCGKCGMKRPDTTETWDCSCGNTGITDNFCGKCGAPKKKLEKGE